MLNKAIEKLKAEMKQNGNNSYIQVVGEFLLQHLEVNPEAAENILQSEKTIGKSLNEMRKVAETKKVENCAVLTDDEGFAIVLKYFDIKGTTLIISKSGIKTAEVKSKNVDFNISLEDLL